MNSVGGIDVDVVFTADMPPCPRCASEGLLSARVPYGWGRGNGGQVEGTTVVVLCPRCDADQPAAGALITFFHVHEQVTEDLVSQCADLIQRWVKGVKIPAVDLNALDAEVDAWQRGELA